MIKKLLLFLGLFLFSHVSLAQVTAQKSLKDLNEDLIKIDRAIDATKDKMKTIKDARFLPELYFVLGELYTSKSRYMINIKRLENPETPQEELDFTPEKKPKYLAIETYQSILDRFPNIQERDKALFFMAHEYRELGELEKMVKTYQQLTANHPNSLYWSESQLILANYILETKKDVPFAVELYQKILNRPPDGFTPLARYKLGWAYINLGKWRDSLYAFEGVLTKDKDVDLSKLPDIYKKTDVKRDALVALVWPYSEIAPWELNKLGAWRTEPVAYLKKLSNNISSFQKALQRMGRRLTIKKRFIEATRVYFTLLQTSQDIEMRMDAINSCYTSMKNSLVRWPINGFVYEISKTVNMIRHSSSVKDKERTVAITNYEIFARDVATRYQQQAKSTHNKLDYRLAIKNYEDYVWAFPESRFNLTMRLNLAESYFNLGNYVDAGIDYEFVAQRLKAPNKKKELYDSALESYSKALKNSALLSRLDLTQARNGLRDVGRIFIANYSRDKVIPEILFTMARTHYDERSFDEAVKAFEVYLSKYPRDNQSRLAADLILDSYNQREDYEGLIAAGQRLLRNKNLSREIHSTAQQVIRQSQLKKIQANAGEAGSPQYAQNLLKFAEQYKGSQLGEQALWEAFMALKAKKDPKAYEPGETLLVKYGNSKYAKEVVSQMGQMSLVTADFRRAATYFETYVQKYPQDTQSRTLMQSAAQMREVMGDHREAVQDYTFLNNAEGIARNFALANDWNSLRASAGRVGGLKGAYWQGLAAYRLDDLTSAKTFLQQAASLKGRDYEETSMAAHALYLLSMEAMKAFKSVQISSGQEAQAVQQKNQMLQNLNGQLSKVASSGSGRWTIAALYGLGSANQEFANFIKKAPIPGGLNTQQVAQYKAGLSQQASQYEKAAQNYFNQCLSSGEKFSVYSQFVKGCRSRGRETVDEESETRVVSKAGQVTPRESETIRKKLYDDSRNASLLIQLAQIYLRNQDYAMGVAILNRALEINAKSSAAVALQGTSYLFMNDLERAAQRFEAALKINPRDATALWGLAGLNREFGYQNKYQSYRSRAQSSGQALPPLHPFVQSAR